MELLHLTGRRRHYMQSEQTGKGRHTRNDSKILKTECHAADAKPGTNVLGRVQTVRRTTPGSVGRTVDGQRATTDWPAND